MRYLIIFAILLTSCLGDFDPREPSTAQNEGEVWICHNPKSEYHGHQCSDQCYWVGQLLVENSYCWVLEEEDCKRPLIYEWQEKNCHFFD